MADADDSLVMRRSKRSTAGNRMEAALAEFHEEDVGMDVEEDVDFVVEKDEEDAFGSDFESTDEEAVQGDVDTAAEKVIREDERTVRKTAYSKLDRITAVAHARNKATFNPEQMASTSQTPTTEKVKRRVSLGVAVNAETGEIMEKTKRYSRRSHTMLNTSATVSRMKDAEEKKSALPKKVKAKVRAPTQDELIARALDMEEGNIIEHRDYLTLEEEKRKRARLVRTSVQGPLIRWVSRGEEIKVKVDSVPLAPYGYTYPSGTAPSGTTAYTPPTYFHPSASQYPAYPPSTSSVSAVSAGQSLQSYYYQAYGPPYAPAMPPPGPTERTEKVTRNYVIHELAQSEDARRPLWPSTMKALFGEHVNWEELRVYTSKGRPLSRPTQLCPISGKVARYLDPRTGVPYANIAAFETLTNILAHKYVWCADLGCYIGEEGDAPQADENSLCSSQHDISGR
ncbi:YL1 nuclear protein-domain-containing protein [Amylocystis lapponica]|nr:YL1 nuclear protein-domain-containing protein [Amylocystis lapponica]